MAPARPDQRPDRLARALRLFARVEPGEGGTVLLLMLTLFLLLTSYYVLKTVREPLILVGGGAELKSYLAAAQAILLLAVVPAYSALVNRVGRVRLINRVGLFFVANLVVFYVLARLHVPYLGVPFFIWVGIFSLMVIAQLWSFANDLYTEEQGKRLFALIAVGSSVGAILGAWFTGRLLAAGVGVYEMMLIAAALLLACVALTAVVQRRERERIAAIGARPQPRTVAAAAGGVDTRSGFTLVLQDRYLLLIALMLLLMNLVNTTGEYILGRTVSRAAAAALPAGGEAELNAFIGGFYADFFTGVNILGALLQMFAVSRIIGRLGLRGAILVLPLIAISGYVALAAAPALLLIRAVKTLENATDYSLQNTVRHALFLPTSPAAKYKAKQAIDTFFVRAGDVASAGVVALGTAIGLTTAGFAILNAGVVLVWLAIALAIGRHHARLRLPLPGAAAVVLLAALLFAPDTVAQTAVADSALAPAPHPGPVSLAELRGADEVPGRGGTVWQHAGHWLLTPPYLALAAATWPLEQAAALNERHHLASRLTRLLVWRLDPLETSFALTFGYDTHIGWSAVGVRARADDWLATGGRLGLEAAYLTPRQNIVELEWRGARGPFAVGLEGRRERKWNQSFYGIGPTTAAYEAHADRALDLFEVDVAWRPARAQQLSLDAYARRNDLAAPSEDFDPDELDDQPVSVRFPGLWEQARRARYRGLEAAWAWDRRPDGEFSQRGTYLRLFGGVNDAWSAGDADYRHWGLETQGYLPLGHGRCLALRAWSEAIDSDDLARVPYPEWAALGGRELLRGYDNRRFVDARSLLLTAEYRWPLFTAIGARLFCDWGAVAPSWSRLQPSRVDPAFGLALTARLDDHLGLAVQAAHGEAWEFYAGTSATFTPPERRKR